MLEALTVNDMSNRILEREEFSNDNDVVKKNFKREMIRKVLNAYIEEMRLAFLDGERATRSVLAVITRRFCSVNSRSKIRYKHSRLCLISFVVRF